MSDNETQDINVEPVAEPPKTETKKRGRKPKGGAKQTDKPAASAPKVIINETVCSKYTIIEGRKGIEAKSTKKEKGRSR